MNDTCSLEGCDRALCRRGYCQTHYKRLLKTGSPGSVEIKQRITPPDECIVEGCTRGASGAGCGRGYCASHYARWRKHGDAGSGDIRHWDSAPDECGVWNCKAETHARGLCSRHHARWLKHGDPGSAELLHKPSGPCELPGCEQPRVAYGYCQKHSRRWKRWGDPEVVHYGAWCGDDATYQAVHSRLQATLGRADAHGCRFCNKPAREWAYTHTDPDVRYDVRLNMPYSLDPKCYMPLCKPCHKRFDANMAK